MKQLITLATVAVFAFGCSDADRASWVAVGENGIIKCYSGGQIFYEGKSTGRIQSTVSSDGWEFKDAATGKFVRVSGDCVIQN